ncbi:MAG: hypothetical protein ACP5VX_05580 [Thermogladius sp.]
MVVRLESQPSQQQGPQAQQPSIPLPSPELTEEQKKVLDALNELILATHELSFAIAVLPPEVFEKYNEIKDLVEAAKNVVKATYKFHKLLKGRGR